ncbi:MAG: hypothetical protein Q6K99_06930 [Thermostichales cyanobacterium BF4_bins_65]
MSALMLYGLVLLAGLVAAVSLGSVAFFNSKRPAGLEGAVRPSYLPQYGDSEHTPPAWDVGWTEQAERWNGRAAMLGILLSVLTEAIVGQSVLGFMFGIHR